MDARLKHRRVAHVTPTINQRRLFRIYMDSLTNGPSKTKKQMMEEAGYSYRTNRTTTVFNAKGFQMLLAQVDDAIVLERLSQILQEGKDRDSLQAAKMLLDLKNRFPQGKAGAQSYEEHISHVLEDTDNTALQQPDGTNVSAPEGPSPDVTYAQHETHEENEVHGTESL